VKSKEQMKEIIREVGRRAFDYIKRSRGFSWPWVSVAPIAFKAMLLEIGVSSDDFESFRDAFWEMVDDGEIALGSQQSDGSFEIVPIENIDELLRLMDRDEIAMLFKKQGDDIVKSVELN
jgi:hypothetical protein